MPSLFPCAQLTGAGRSRKASCSHCTPMLQLHLEICYMLSSVTVRQTVLLPDVHADDMDFPAQEDVGIAEVKAV